VDREHFSMVRGYAPRGYEIFRDKAEGCLKIALPP
jgi:hypothetical protein